MSSYEMDDVVLTSPETTEETGQETTTESTKEVPEESGQTSEQSNQETKTEETEGSSEKKERKFANIFASRAILVKSAENLAGMLDEEVNFDDMTTKDIEVWYLKNHSRKGKEGFKGDREKVKKINEATKTDERLARIEEKLDKVNQPPVKEESKPEQKELLPPVEPEFDWDVYNEMLIDDPKEAAKMQREYDKSLKKYQRDLIEFEGMRLYQLIGSDLVEVKKGQQKSRAEEAQVAERKEWDNAFISIAGMVEEDGGPSFSRNSKAYDENLEKMMDKLIAEDFDYYDTISKSDKEQGKKRAVLKLYGNALKELELENLKIELAKSRNGETQEQIDAAKGIARINSGGVNSKTITTTNEQTGKEASLAAVRGPSSKYDLDY